MVHSSSYYRIHLLNAGKYTASIAYYFAYFGWRIHGSERGWRMAVWLIFSVINSCYVLTWVCTDALDRLCRLTDTRCSQDVVMDWSLFRKGSRHFLLRSELGFKESVWTYYGAPWDGLIATRERLMGRVQRRSSLTPSCASHGCSTWRPSRRFSFVAS